MKCLNCKQEVSDKAKYCSDKCRMAYTRRTKAGDLPEQIEPEQTRTLDFKATRTDSLFESHKPNYYKFEDATFERTCLECGKGFKTHLKLLRACSPDCMLKTVNSLTV